jgi:hypothetical protein
MFRFTQVVLAASLAFTTAYAQTFTSCNPLNTTCPSDIALGQYAEFDFTQTQANPTVWNSTSTPLGFGANGAEFTIVKSGDSPTVKTNFYLFFGSISVVMRAAPGTGIVSSIVLMSDDLDEVDWEVCLSFLPFSSWTPLLTLQFVVPRRQQNNGAIQLLWKGKHHHL